MTRKVLAGRIGSPGAGRGWLLVVPPTRAESTPGSGPIGSPESEHARLVAALETAAGELETLARQLAERAGEEIGAIFEAQALFARDPGIVDPATHSVDAGADAAEAIIASTEDQASTLAAVDDEYFRARAADVRDVGRRVAGILRGEPRSDLWHADGRPAIVVADDLDPSAVATLRSELVAGIALASGAPTGHASIVARGIGIPMVLGLGPAALVLPNAIEALVDGTDGRSGRLVIEPDDEDVSILSKSARDASVAEPRDTAASGDVTVAVSANVGSVLEAEAAARTGAAGVGLVRTELLFLGRATPPSVAEQRNLYARIREAMDGRPVVFRTLDVGGDKPTAWQADRPEANPALGVRGVRLGLARPELLDAQLRALAEAAGGGEVRVMLPMVSTVEEVIAVRARLDAIVATVDPAPSSVLLGVMIEVPAAAIMADGLAQVADFFSIGTNDLVQYTLAADRINPSLGELATALQPAVLRLLAGVVAAARAHGRHVAVCGEAAADPEMIPLLVGLGVDELSVAPSSVVAVRALVGRLRLAACQELAAASLRMVTVGDIRRSLAVAEGAVLVPPGPDKAPPPG